MSLPKRGLFSLVLAWLPAQRGIVTTPVESAPAAPSPTPAPDNDIHEFQLIKAACDQINGNFDAAFSASPALGRKELENKAILHTLIVSQDHDMEIHMMKDGPRGRYVALNIRIMSSPCFDSASQSMTSQYQMVIDTKDNASPQPQTFCPGDIDKMEEAVLEAIWNKLDETQQERLNHSTWPYPYFQAAAAAAAPPPAP